jgi:DNA repair exonuclease SbcCD ATPase subunit
MVRNQLEAKLEAERRRVAQTEEELSIAKAKLDEATERAGELEDLVEKATQLAEAYAEQLVRAAAARPAGA